MKLDIKSIGVVIIFIIIFLILLILQFLHRVSESHYSILDQTGKVELKDYPEIKDELKVRNKNKVSFNELQEIINNINEKKLRKIINIIKK